MNKLVGVMAVEVVFWLVWLAEDCEVQGSNHANAQEPAILICLLAKPSEQGLNGKLGRVVMFGVMVVEVVFWLVWLAEVHGSNH